MAKMQRISPYLWFNDQAEEAAKFYTSIFKNSEIKRVMRQGDRVLLVDFTLEGTSFQALNGGPMHQFTEACSFVVHCKNQKEVDYYWECLTADGGSESACAWLKDKFGLSWQVVPQQLGQLLGSSDQAVAGRAMANMLQMRKIKISQLTKEPKTIKCSVSAIVNAPIEKAWEAFTNPKHVMAWNQASPDWHCPAATNDLRDGGSFSYTMAAKDGSFSFDLTGSIDKVVPQKRLDYTLSDGRSWVTTFRSRGKKTEVSEVFVTENQHPVDFQRAGWQAILDSFAAHAATI